ncbi:MAG: UDP-N-acetylmuramate dehydrogenase [Ruminococcaceae bacterium]|nr:UDP-N-acetylmuramate dehydrogenase [Oscillospiraceae bacterium]
MAYQAHFAAELAAAYPQIPLRLNEPMAAHTTFRIGGPAACMALPQDAQQLKDLLLFAQQRELPVLLLGGGSNLLCPDEGLQALVIKTKEGLTNLERIGKNRIRAHSGVTMARLAQFAAQNGLSGLEFAQGIPGTVGGGIYMNAGAYGGEMCQVVVSSEAVSREGEHRLLRGDEHGFSYRRSVYMDTSDVIVSAEFELTPDDPALIRERMQDLASRRREKQPLEYPSAGSAFKRPEGAFAAALIDSCGLKGLQVGGAAVSKKHAGFIVNLGGATADDVKRLIALVQQRVEKETGFMLEPEIRIL